ncbi:MAG: desulfoferrodoxin [Spirochaetes bacterium GWF1_41_5]|nr:MAG: desulfoferrodoxin [Spirochaetes bacterium GWF1_41_5]HBE02193.1 desulfoferrodoxin [Spirochaetia bacterium]
MLNKKSVYKCEKCGNIIEGLWNGKPSVSCCGQEMTELKANTVDASKEKHVPVIERNGSKVTVKIGSAAHPMQPEHYILFIEVLAGDKVYRHDLKTGDTAAQAVFCIEEKNLTVRAYCNLHGLWEAKE